MSSRRQEIHLQFNQFVDAILLGATFWLAHFIRYKGIVVFDSLWSIGDFSQFAWMLVLIMPFGPLLLELQGFYSYPLENTVWKSLRQMSAAAFWLLVLLSCAVIFLKLAVPSRSVLILFAIMAPVVLLAREWIFILLYSRSLRKGNVGERIVLAGEPERMKSIVSALTPSQKLEIRVVAEIDLERQSVEDLIEAIHRHSVGRVVLSFQKLSLDRVQRAIEVCETEGIEAWMSADFIHTSTARPSYDTLAKHPMLVFRTTPELSWVMLLKSTLDRAGAFLGLIVCTPIFLVVAAAIKLTSPGPIFFRQHRAGLHGRPFDMWKFRSMCADAESKREDLSAFNVMRGPVFKIEEDPRITPLGKWLRKTSIDELPQLYNVFKGEMSLVGPRPLPVYEVEKFERTAHRRRLSVKPGLTCLWQIRGRNKVTDFQDWVRMDLEYIDNWSFLLDVYILLRTIPIVLFGWGAK